MKLGVIGLIPILFIIFLALSVQSEKQERLNTLEQFRLQIQQSANVNNFISELQSERRYAFAYAVSQHGESNMLLQQVRTDEALEKIQPTPGSRLEGFQQFTSIEDLAGFRQRIIEKKVTEEEVMEFYSNIIFRLNSVAPVFTGAVTYLEPIALDLRGQRTVSEMITYLGMIRGSLYLSMYYNRTREQTRQQIAGMWNLYRNLEREFTVKAPAEAVNSLSSLTAETEYGTTTQYIQEYLNGVQQDSVYSAEDWWNLSARGVDQLKGLERSLHENVVRYVNNVYENEKNDVRNNLIFLMVIIVLLITLTIFTIKGIADSLSELRMAAEQIAKGATNIPLRATSRDSIGSLTHSILAIDINNRKLSEAAASIGEGDFDVAVEPRSSEDMLGNAILRMKEDLQEFTRNNEEKLWIQEGLTVVSKAVRGDKDLKVLADDALSALVSYTEGAFGLLYVARKNTLDFTSGYALPDPRKVPQQVLFGETLVGQAALGQKTSVLDKVPADYFHVTSSLGSTPPESVMILPLMHNDIVEGVVELAFQQMPEKKTVHFLQEASSGIAIALQAAKNRARLQELLEETQSQAEELQAQHNELENINAELEAQAEKLQASEEELKVQQEELQQANQELEEQTRILEERNLMILEKNSEIEKKAGELEISTRYKSEFLANMSHELRTPLNSILLLSRLLGENNEKNLNEEQVEYARVIQSSGNGLLSLIDEILDLSKIEAGKMTLEYERVSLKEIARELKSTFEPLAQEKQLELIIREDPGLPERFETDRLRLIQILRNLLSNAIKFTQKGSVTLSISPHQANRKHLKFSVTDTGIGIPKDKQAIIFEAFQQADGSTRRKFGGTGLGLSISREIVKMLGGWIELESEAGRGSTFTVYVPLEKVPQKEQHIGSPAESAADEPAKGIKVTAAEKYLATEIPENIPDDRNFINEGDKVILIVEDDTAFAHSLLEYTRKKGYKGVVTVRGDEGLELAKQFNPIGILLDVQLPVKSGWQVMEELKKDPLTRGIPVHMMSSHQVKKESLQKGAIDFINKPVAFDQMQEVFRKLEHVLSKEPKKVLIVEENSKHAKALSYFLESFRVNTEIKTDIPESVKALTEDVDCVILDMGIPDQQAYEMLEQVKQNEGLENIPIIIFTGKSLSLAEEQRIRQYADSIVVKTVHSYQRILDEVSIFLHLVDTPAKTQEKGAYKKLGAITDVLKDKKVLIVDDDVRNIFSLTKALEKMEMQVITAVDGKEALEKLRLQGNVDMVLLDMMMPEMDGYETARQIRKNFAWRDLPIIAVTAKAMTGDREKCIAAGASDYITKPVDIDQLLSLLRVWLYEGVK